VQDVPADETLAPDADRDALVLARTSWPLSLILAQYYQPRNDPRVDDLARQFADLVANELDTGRLVKFYEDVESAAADIVLSCAPEVAERLTSVLSERFLIDGADIRRRAQKKVGRTQRSTKGRGERVRT